MNHPPVAAGLPDYRHALAAAALLLVTVLAAASLIPRTSPVGPQLVRNPTFSDGLSQWQVRGRGGVAVAEGGTLVLRNEDSDRPLAVTQRHAVPPESDRLLLTVETAARGIQRGVKRWNTGRGVLVSIVDGKPNYRISHEAFRLLGDRGWTRQSRLFTIPPAVDELVLQFQLARATGELKVRAPTLYPVVYTDAWRWIRPAALVLGGLGLAWMFAPYLRVPASANLAGVALVGFIVLACLVPNELKIGVYIWAKGALQFVPAAQAAESAVGRGVRYMIFEGEHIRAFGIGHFLCFTGAAFCLTLARSPVPLYGRLLQLLLLGALTEALQLYVPDRGSSLLDWGIDSLGIALGAVLALATLRFTDARGREAMI